jgi:hypothetical protein
VKYFLFLLFYLLFTPISGQNFTAKVVDENNEPLVSATVYFDGTTRGVITNLEGVFNIEKPENLTELRLVITYLGYESLFIDDVENLKVVYQLQPKAENLNTVNLYSSPFSREEMIEVFRRNFLGVGKPARQCEILNLDDVVVYFKTENNTLYAEALNPVIVQNNYLGYKVSFDIKAFSVNFSARSLDELYQRQSFYAGFSFFEDIDSKKDKKRQKVYERSLDKFLKSLVNGTLDQTKFQVGYQGFLLKPEKIFEVKPIDNNLFEVSLKPDVIKTFNGRYVPSKIILKYKSEMSTLQFQNPQIRVDQFGNNIDIQNILLIGEISKNKIAKMLPTNFTTD